MAESQARVHVSWISRKGNPKSREFKSVNKTIRFMADRINSGKPSIEQMKIVFAGHVMDGFAFFRSVYPIGTPVKSIKKKYRAHYTELAKIVYPLNHEEVSQS